MTEMKCPETFEGTPKSDLHCNHCGQLVSFFPYSQISGSVETGPEHAPKTRFMVILKPTGALFKKSSWKHFRLQKQWLPVKSNERCENCECPKHQLHLTLICHPISGPKK